jgi:outer membrane protein assembly factor BamE (lipoprotein component of BamABCDE complex)
MRVLSITLLASLIVIFLSSSSPVVPAAQKGYVTLGMLRESVYQILGPPRSISKVLEHETWYYGHFSSIRFERGAVVGWDERDTPLRVFLGNAKPDAENVRPGVSRSIVIAALGTPRELSRILEYETWYYGRFSSVKFRRGIVEGYDVRDADLHIGAGPNGHFIEDGEHTSTTAPRYTYQTVTYPAASEESLYSFQVSRQSSGTAVRNLGRVLSNPTTVRWPVGVPEYITRFRVPTTFPGVAENGSYYGEISKITGLPRTIYVHSYFRRDGTYVRSHFRSRR